MAKKPWYDDFGSWMKRRGTLDKITKLPRRGMAKSTVQLYLLHSKKAMRVVGVLGPKNQVIVRIRRIRPRHLIKYFKIAYPDGYEGVESKWHHEARALRKMAQWIYFDVKRRDKPVWTKDDLELVQREVYTVPIPKPAKPDITEDFLDRVEHKFFPWLKENKPFLWGPTGFLFYSSDRINEVAGMDVGLESGTVIRLANGDVEVEGKSESGIKRFDITTLTEEAEAHLIEWEKVRAAMPPNFHESDALFPNKWGGRLGIQSNFNRNLRKAALASGFFTGTCDKNGNHYTGEIALFRSHIIGRAASITRMAHDGVEMADRMRISRHRDPAVHLGYTRVDTKAAASRASAAARKRLNGNGNSMPKEKGNPLDDMSRDELLQLLQDISERLR